MTVSSLAHLPEPVLQQLLGGLLLTHFRSAHPNATDLYVFHNYQVQVDQGFLVQADWAIVDRQRHGVLAVFELLRTKSQLQAKQHALRQLRSYAASLPYPMRVGAVAPESIAPTIRGWLAENDVDLVTYPA